MTYSLLAVALALSLLILAILTAIAFKLRGWFWNIHTDIASLHRALEASKEEVRARIAAATLEIINANSLNQLGQTFPVFLGGWSVDAFLGRWLIQHLVEERPKCILELGSGSSTVLIARSLQLLGEADTAHIVVDHEVKYLGITRDISQLNGVADNVEFLHCPLENYASVDKLWYGGLIERLGAHKIDLLIIDGPPGPLQPMSRYPALPLLMEHLAEHCTIVLDDAVREEEQEIARRWINENPGFELTVSFDGHGLAILKR
ncbi:MAG: class I SAM-dependent methyltransferase [Thiobacillus sp.]|nr:class I SAM-dependent methyltransferase [Thiobacillus sp.]